MATIRQKLVFAKVVENGGIVSKAMITKNPSTNKPIYSPNTAKTPSKLTNTKGWKELTEQYLPDRLIAKRHHEQINSSKLTKLYFDIDDDDRVIESVCKKLGVELLYIKINKAKDGKTVNVKAPDLFFRDLAIDKAYKMKGKYGSDNSTQINIGIIGVDINIRKNGTEENSELHDTRITPAPLGE